MKKTIYRLLIHWRYASGRSLPNWLERACQNDPTLAQERALERQLTQKLRENPSVDFPAPSKDFRAKLIQRITEEKCGEEERLAPGFSLSGWMLPASVAAVAAIFAFVGLQISNTELSMTEEEETMIAVGEVTPKPASNLLEAAVEWKNPLDQEMEYLVSDARSALDFLAETFLPSRYRGDDDQA